MPAAITDPKRRALGKGLESLLPSRPAPTPPPPQVVAPPEPTGKPLEIPLDQIERNPYQTRTHFDEAKLAELAQSIIASGVVQPIVVRPLPGGRYQLITGERRWLASKKANKATIPAIVRQVSDEQTLEMTIVENLQRADLNPIEQARAYQRLSNDFKMTQEQMAIRTGKERASVSNFLRLLRLPDSVQQKVESGDLSFGHARTLLALESAGRDHRRRPKGHGALPLRPPDRKLRPGPHQPRGEREEGAQSRRSTGRPQRPRSSRSPSSHARSQGPHRG